jgi:hypothetical protein
LISFFFFVGVIFLFFVGVIFLFFVGVIFSFHRWFWFSERRGSGVVVLVSLVFFVCSGFLSVVIAA